VSLQVRRGEIVALLGENGAGKSTLIKTLGGIYAPDSGQVLVDGAPYKHISGKLAAKQAVAFIHQDLGLIEWMSVAENIALAVGYSKRGGRIDWPATEARARAALALVEADFEPTARVSSLTRTENRWWRSPALWRWNVIFWCWMNPPPACLPMRWNGCLQRCGR